MSDCDRCGQDIYTECHCQINEMSKQLEKLEQRVGKLEKEIQCYDHNKAMQEYKKQMEKAQDNLINCYINGCKNFETRCKDCGEVVNTTILGLNDENKQSSPKNITEIPTKEGNSGWIDREVEFPDCDKILCCGGKEIFICQLVESKWGNHYRSTDWGHNESDDPREWTHWMPLPQPPKNES